MQVPLYRDLPLLGDTGERSSWGVFGAGDNYGTLNFLTPTQVAAAARLVKSGETVSLDLPLGQPQPQFWAHRPPVVHAVRTHRRGRDDHLDGFNLQGSTQWDGLRHVRFRQFGYYGGIEDDVLDASDAIGIGHWAERGIIGRGVLIDVAAYLAATGTPIVPAATIEIGRTLIEETLAHQGTAIAPGDILLVRSGWLAWYMALPDAEKRGIVERYEADRASYHAPGIDPGLETVAWLWDQRIAAIAIDTPTFEVLPYEPARGWAHHRLLALLGMPLGELWYLEVLAGKCEALGRHHFFLTSAPLKVTQGVGTPANAYAIF